MKGIALNLLREMTGHSDAVFHYDQWESISELLQKNKKLLVVQRTGWGKSAVYFIATKMLRQQGNGPSIIISPLISLMRNQIESAAKLGLNVVSINSSLSKEERAFNEKQIISGHVDAVIISPEQLANDRFVSNVLQHIISDSGLFVVDEAHCISDWGHDFRPDYRRIVSILQQMPPNVPILATTATANNRVVEDVTKQLGDDLSLKRGPLTRESLQLQNIGLKSKSERLAWLSKIIPTLKGSGIIYTKTTADCELVGNWLRTKGVNAKAYYGSLKNMSNAESAEARKRMEQELINNELKVLVSTSALGMGFDKPDIGFVIHFQAPGNVVEYYQQVGRAGRGIKHAVGILMLGKEDERIQSFFIKNAFPSEDEVNLILGALENSDGLKLSEMEKNINLSSGKIEKALKFLNVESPSPILKDGATWYRTTINYQLPHDRIEHLSNIKSKEWEDIKTYHNLSSCLMRYLSDALDDDSSANCGKCANCQPVMALDGTVEHADVIEASRFLKRRYVHFTPKRLFAKSGALATEAFPVYQFPYKIGDLVAEPGFALSRWRDEVWGTMVADGKIAGHFDDKLVDAMVEMIKEMPIEQQPKWMTYIPSHRHPTLVKGFTERLANKLGLHISHCLSIAQERPPQKRMENSYHRSKNLDGAFGIDPSQVYSDPVFLVDDAVDSGWTFTVATALLKNLSAGSVFPIALTSTSNHG